MSRLKVFTAVVAGAVLAGAGVAAVPVWATVDHVAIVVIDNFAVAPVVPHAAPLSANCPYLPGKATNVVGDSGAGDDLPAGVSHGTAVQSRLSEELDATAGLSGLPTVSDLSPYGLAGMPGILGTAKRWKYGAHELTLIGMDTAGSTTQEFASLINELVGHLRSSGISRVVLNMSFVIAPCNVPAWLLGIGRFDPDTTLAAYEDLINLHHLDDLRDELGKLQLDPDRATRLLFPAANDPLIPLRTELALGEFYGSSDPNANVVLQPQAAVRNRLNADPLKQVLTELAGSAPVVPVGAAGNGVLVKSAAGLDRTRFYFPFAPALWDSVVSVSGGGDAWHRAGYSNNGEVVMEGMTHVDRGDGNQVEVLGSSFAAPRLSARVAVYLLTGGPSPCDGHLPVLGYTNSELDDQLWQDNWLEQAANTYCAGFIDHMTLT